MSNNNKQKLCFIDVETTGLDCKKSGIFELSVIITDLDGVELDSIDISFNPGDVYISEEALGVVGMTREEILSNPKTSHEAYLEFTEFLSKHVNRFDRKDKLHFMAYNAPFDSGFVREWMARNDDKYYGAYFYHPPVCVMNAVAFISLPVVRGGKFNSFKLSSICEAFNIEWDENEAHASNYDIRKTLELYTHL
jgi:DNA polymerase III alpha subunit (gram-positive type)